jgi:Domain of unknown function (DUF4198)
MSNVIRRRGFCIRRPMPNLCRVALIAATLLGTVPARAHEYWIAPSTYAVTPGDSVRVSAFVGTGFRGELKTYQQNRTMRLAVRGHIEQDLRPFGVDGSPVFTRFAAPDDGGFMIGYESSFYPIGFAADEFDRYLALEGLDGPLAERKAKPSLDAVRERYARCSKTWVAGAKPDARRVFGSLGLTYELVPLTDPARPGPLQLRLLYKNSPLTGGLVRAWRRPLANGTTPLNPVERDSVGVAVEARSGPGGIVVLNLEGEGEWLVSSVHMVRCPQPRAADWESHWASLTFARIQPTTSDRSAP